MVDTPKGSEPRPGETAPREPLKNEDKPKGTPAEEKPKEDVEKLQTELKEARKQAMRTNQLENELSDLKKKEAERERQELEDKEEYKTLAEQEKAKREELEAVIEDRDKKSELRKATKAVLDDYSDEVKELAKDTGLTLSDISDDAIADFKGRLDKIAARVSSSSVTPNNPPNKVGGREYTQEELYEILRDPAKRDAYYREKYPTTAAMMEPERG